MTLCALALVGEAKGRRADFSRSGLPPSWRWPASSYCCKLYEIDPENLSSRETGLCRFSRYWVLWPASSSSPIRRVRGPGLDSMLRRGVFLRFFFAWVGGPAGGAAVG